MNISENPQLIIKNLVGQKRISAGAIWGTKLDDIKVIPTQYAGISFQEMDHDKVEEFITADPQKQFEVAYWVERASIQLGMRRGVVVGVIVGALFAIFLQAILNLL